ncbi:MAG: hypothetical protein R3B90_13500 [Planctomycetaceae bacterium]
MARPTTEATRLRLLQRLKPVTAVNGRLGRNRGRGASHVAVAAGAAGEEARPPLQAAGRALL